MYKTRHTVNKCTERQNAVISRAYCGLINLKGGFGELVTDTVSRIRQRGVNL